MYLNLCEIFLCCLQYKTIMRVGVHWEGEEQGQYFIWQLTSTLHSASFAWQQAEQHSPHFQLAVSCSPHISVQCFVVSITFLTNYPTPWNRVLLERVIVPQLVKIFPKFCGTECSLQHSQEPTTCQYPNQINPVITLPTELFNVHLNIIFLCLSLSFSY